MTDDKDDAGFDEAFAKAQGEMPNAKLNKINPHFQSRYADIASIKEATVPALTKHGFGIRQFTKIAEDGKLVLITRLARKGIREDGEYPIALDRPQAMGSSLTYGRRYNWALMTGVAFEEDDDATEAEKQATAPASKTKTKATARADGDYEALTDLMRECMTKAELKAFVLEYSAKIEALPDSWKTHLREEYSRLMAGLDE